MQDLEMTEQNTHGASVKCKTKIITTDDDDDDDDDVALTTTTVPTMCV